MIKEGEDGWEEFLPPYVDMIIKEKKLFGYKASDESTVVVSDEED